MESPLSRVAVAVVRAWTRLYTWRMEPALAAARREDIESDLWEYEHDPTREGLNPTLHVLVRLILGMPSDVGWRVETSTEQRLPRRATLAAAVLAVAAFWLVPAWLSRGQPDERTRIDQCATALDADSTASLTRADYRMRIITCAGAFFAGRTPASGLQKLEAGRAPVDVLVIDSVERPTED